ncbi:queuosine precursor transporter [Paenibacillus sp. J31TS4]|uniref:queuosine precursor transporter n=1 Tax=Paenibacillus sp. J31TS4 TaxID=2807195 RepID=UPI001BCAA603|nr:queuosine precursor transporter [Paenibacillus sp. J31TS4]
MFNPLWGLLFMLAHFALFLLCYRLFGRTGLYAWVGFATVLANIQVTKTIEMFGIVMTLGNTMYTTLYMASDLLNEKYGRREAQRAVWFGFFSLLASTALMQMTLVFTPQETDFAQEPLEKLFGLMPWLAAASLTAYFVSQFLDVRLYSWLRRRFPAHNQFWVRINGSTVLSQLVDSLVFCTIAFALPRVYSFDVWLQIFLTTYLFKFVISVASTPVLYAARRFRTQDEPAAGQPES